MDVRDYLNILHVAEKLKDTPRHCTTSAGRTESVAEHSWRISLMAFLLRSEFTEADTDKIIKMCLIHDLGECFTGDIPTFIKTDNDRDVEDSLLNQWLKSLPEEISKEMMSLYEEMDAQKTIESKIYKALDKLEALIQHNESPLETWSENEYELNKTYAFDTVAFSDWLTELRKAILEDTLVKIEQEAVQTIIGKTVRGIIDRPIGSRHPQFPDMVYPINYGYIEGVFAGDGEEQDAYVLGTDKPIDTFEGKVIAVYHRFNDEEDKWIVSLDGSNYSDDEILRFIKFQEQYYEGELIR